MISIKNTSFGCLEVRQNASQASKISKIQESIITGDKGWFSTPCDIILGNSSKVNYSKCYSFTKVLNNTTSLLSKANSVLSEMYDNVMQMEDLYIGASLKNITQDQLAYFETLFQERMNYLDQIAENASYFSLSLLNGDMNDANSYKINFPDSNADMAITLPDMRNSATPIANPSPDDPQIALPCTIAEFDAAIDIPVGNPANVLINIKKLCGKDSFLYVVANEINEAFNAGLTPQVVAANQALQTCAAYLQGVNWDDLLPPDKALAASNLINNPNFMTLGGANILGTAIPVIMRKLVNTQDESLLYVMQNIIAHNYIPPEYVTKASPILSIASPDYFGVVGSRLKLTIDNIINAQASINLQIKGLEGICNLYNNLGDNNLEKANNYIKTNILEASTELNNCLETIKRGVSILSFKHSLKEMIFQAAHNLMRNTH